MNKRKMRVKNRWLGDLMVVAMMVMLLCGISGMSLETTDISSAVIELSQETFEYDMDEHTPEICVTYNEITLEKDKDYRVRLEDNVNAGTAKVIVFGIGAYSGELSKTFSIAPLSIAGDEFECDSEEIVYDKDAHSPKISIQWDGQSLVEDVDFTVQAVAETDAGDYEVIVTGIGNFKGSKTVAWSIDRAPVDVRFYPEAMSMEYTGAAQSLVEKGTVDGGYFVYSLKVNGTYSKEIPKATEAGTYPVYYRVIPDGNHESDETGTVNVSIGRSAVTIDSAPLEKTLVYNTQQQELVENGVCADGEFVYSLSADGPFEAAIPTAKNADTYNIYYKVVGDRNHEDSYVDYVVTIIERAIPEYEIPTGLIGNCQDPISSVTLPEQFDWNLLPGTKLTDLADENDVYAETELAFTPEDANNYEAIYNVPVKIKLVHDLACQSNGAGKHSGKCQNCGYEQALIDCSGGKATCVAKAVCSVCHDPYGSVDATNHTYVNGVCSGCKKMQETMGNPEDPSKDDKEPGKELGQGAGKEDGKEDGQEPGKITGSKDGVTKNNETVISKEISSQKDVSQKDASQIDTSKTDATSSEKLELGKEYIDGKTKFVITDLTTKEVQYVGCTSKNAKTITIPATATCEGVSFKVTSVKAGALKGYKKVTKIVVGKNVKKIGNNAFSGCKNLKTLTIKSTKLTSSSLSKKAFAGITKATKLVVPKSKLKTYKKLFPKKGLAKSVKVTA